MNMHFPAVNMFVCIELLRHLCSASRAAATRPADPALRIIGGRDALDGEFPYIVQLIFISEHGGENILKTENKLSNLLLNKNNGTQNNKKTFKTSSPKANQFCSGSVVNPVWTLTAHHCVTQKNVYICDDIESTCIIVSGNIQGVKDEDYTKRKVLKTKTLPLQRSEKLTYEDIALLNHEPLQLREYAKVSAVDYTTLYGHEVTIAGYGMTVNASGALDLALLLKMPLQVIEKTMLKKCDLNDKDPNEYVSMCVVPACGQRTQICGGDSGGPILHVSGVVGVVSRGVEQCLLRLLKAEHYRKLSSEILTVTPVSPFLEWISNVVA